MFSSLINDVVSITRMRIMDKPIRFITNIDAKIPRKLVGDELRLRQLILNLLSNAVKFTEQGHITLSITEEKQEGKKVWLKFIVSDTGCGIKTEDQAKSKKTRGIEGIGLGLAIIKRFCDAMGGNIKLESKYGKGSSFIVSIPQEIDCAEPFASVDEAHKKKVIVYERRTGYAKSLCWSLENLKVPYSFAADEKALEEALGREEYSFIISGFGLYYKIKTIMENISFAGDKHPSVALMLEKGTEGNIPNVSFLSIPVQTLNIANLLNNIEEGKGYSDTFADTKTIRFTLPSVRILIVDDIATNLKVAEGVLAPYKAKLDTCLSGAKAIDMIKQRSKQNQDYDLVFMDHLMPEMDGIETVRRIREWEKEQENKCVENAIDQRSEHSPKQSEAKLPIVALTAYVVAGTKEMFIENDFNDFLSKPIDIVKLDEMLERWIPKEKRVKVNEEKKLVLLVDDNRENLRLGMSALEDKYDVITAPSAEKMIMLLENNKPDLILVNSSLKESLELNTASKDSTPIIYITEPNEKSSLLLTLQKHFGEENV